MTSSQQISGRPGASYAPAEDRDVNASIGSFGLDRLLGNANGLDRFSGAPGTLYKVKQGDTLSRIAKEHGTTWQVLARINGLSNPDRIAIGQSIRLPANSSTTHVVQRGETLGGIAAANGTTIAALARTNGISDPNRIFAGQVIRIRSAPPAPPAVPARRSDAPTPNVPDVRADATRVTGGALAPGAASLRAADIAERRASGHKSEGACYAWVKDALLAAGATKNRLSGVPAKGAGPQLVANGFVNVLSQPGNTIRSPYDAPPGAILVYGAAPGATDKNVKWGHIEIRTRNGFASDYFSARARTGPATNGLEGRGRVLIGVYIKPDAKSQTAPVQTGATTGTSPVTKTTPAPSGDLVARLGSVITKGEGNYESYNSGTKGVKGGKVGHSYLHPAEGSVTGKTINQILATESLSGYDSNRMFATGKYQTTIGTLRAAKEKLGLTGNERYTPELQERVFREFLLDKAGGGKLAAFVRNGTGTVETAQYAAAKEWASIAVPQGLRIGDGRISDGTMSYYEKKGTNSANMSATRELRELLTTIAKSR